LENANN